MDTDVTHSQKKLSKNMFQFSFYCALPSAIIIHNRQV